MSKTDMTEVHERRHRVFLDRHELERLVADAVLGTLKVRRGQGVKVCVSFEDAKEGSPEYRVGTKARVDVVEDLLPQTLAYEPK